MYRFARKFYNGMRRTSIFLTRLLAFPQKKIADANRIVLLNIQYMHAFSEFDLLCGVALSRKGHDVRAIVCPGLDYCEREDYQTAKPNCQTCRRNTIKYCKAYGIQVVEAKPASYCYPRKTHTSDRSSDKVFGLKTPIIEFIHRNYMHFKKGFNEIDYPVWKRIEGAADTLAKYISNLDLDYSKIDKVITSNGRFFQTGIPLEMLAPNDEFITTEVFNDSKIALGYKTYSLNSELELSALKLQNIVIDEEKVETFIENKGILNDSSINVWSKTRVENTKSFERANHIKDYDSVISYFPNIVWDSTWNGLGHFCYSPSAFISQLNSLAKKYPNKLFIIRAHPGETNVPQYLAATSPIIRDLSSPTNKLNNNVVYIDAGDPISSYAIGDISDYIIVWNGTLGPEFAARGKQVLSIADSYYEKFNLVTKINSIEHLEQVLADDFREDSLTDKKELARRIIYVNRYLKRLSSPIHHSTVCTKFTYQALEMKEKVFLNYFPEYFNGTINIYELNDLLNATSN